MHIDFTAKFFSYQGDNAVKDRMTFSFNRKIKIRHRFLFQGGGRG
jgi:hypothetical protein